MVWHTSKNAHAWASASALAAALSGLLVACRSEAPERARATPLIAADKAKGPPSVPPTLQTHLLFGERSSAPVVIVMHGFGADGDDLVPLANWLGTRTPYRFLVAEAPHALPQGGRAWWNIDMAARETRLRRGEGLDLREDRPEGVDSARELVNELLRYTASELHADADHVALLGFSQGAMLAMETTLHMAAGPRCLVMLSGTFLSSDQWQPRFHDHRRTPVFMSHGVSDSVLPFALSNTLKDTLKSEGYDVTFVPFRGGHEVPRDVLEPLVTFLQRNLGPA